MAQGSQKQPVESGLTRDQASYVQKEKSQGRVKLKYQLHSNLKPVGYLVLFTLLPFA